MTHLQFQHRIQKLDIPGTVIDYRFNRKLKRFEIVVTAYINGAYMNLASYFDEAKLNDDRLVEKTLNEFPGKVIRAIEKAKKKFTIN